MSATDTARTPPGLPVNSCSRRWPSATHLPLTDASHRGHAERLRCDCPLCGIDALAKPEVAFRVPFQVADGTETQMSWPIRTVCTGSTLPLDISIRPRLHSRSFSRPYGPAAGTPAGRRALFHGRKWVGRSDHPDPSAASGRSRRLGATPRG